MTTSTAARIVEHVEGVVQTANERGLRLVGETDYRNFSRYTTEPIAPPSRGSSVRLGLDASGFVRELEMLGAAPSQAAPGPRDREIRRMTAIKIAANVVGQFAQTREEVKTDHVFPLADRILAWIEQPEQREEGDAF